MKNISTMIKSSQIGELVNSLEHFFGYSSFRGKQEEIIRHLMGGQDTVVIMPTGAGKSLCFQLPALLLEGTAIVVSPLIALMKNQVDQLVAKGINAGFLNSSLSRAEVTKVRQDVLEGEIKILYVAPETLAKAENLAFFRKINLSFIAIDEAHCISEWGHDFRPEYRKLRLVVEELGNRPIIALTATATTKVQKDIQRTLGLEEAKVFKTSFHRENLYYEVVPKLESKQKLVQFVRKRKGQSGIIYCLSRKKVEELAELLQVNGVKALPYHAGLEPTQRIRHQDAFLNEEVEVVTATIAFGMGIDKADVRYVVHYDVPKSLEGYYQETGRAGRDGNPAHCMMLFSKDDIHKFEKFNKGKSASERENVRLLLEEMSGFAESAVCRTRQLLSYFDEHTEEGCGHCDNCERESGLFPAKDSLALALNAVELSAGRLVFGELVSAICGEGHELANESIFGEGREKGKSHWEAVLRQAIIGDFIQREVEPYGILTLTETGKKFLAEPYALSFIQPLEYPEKCNEEAQAVRGAQEVCDVDQVLLSKLKALRLKVAGQRNVPEFVVFQDDSLEAMCRYFPTTNDALVQIHGVGAGKARKFGKPFIELVKAYVEENEILVEDLQAMVCTQPTKSKNKVFVIRQIDNKVDFEEIAESLEMDLPKLIEEVEHICFAGTKLDIAYYADSLLDEEPQEEIYQYFLESDTDCIEEALEEFDGEYSEEELRVMRLKFFAEQAM